MANTRTTRSLVFDPSVAASLFSSSVFREMARSGYSRAFANIAREAGVDTAFSPDSSVRLVFDSVFHQLSKYHRTEYIYKSAIAKKILLGRHSLNTAVMMTEFRVASNKADVVILNGTSTAYEIKSDFDKLDRLSAQVDSYLAVFARVCVITADTHVDAILKLVPSETGILRLTRRGSISTLREPVENPNRIIPSSALDVLQIHEAKKVLQKIGHSIPKVPNTKMYIALRDKFDALESSQVHSAMIEVLRSTRRHHDMAAFMACLPASMQVLSLANPIKRSERENLIRAINSPLFDALQWS